MPSITPTLWFDDNLEEAATFYASIFPNSSVDDLTGVAGSFVLDGQRFVGINGGPHFTFNEAVSFTINCKDQDEVDFYWDRLTADGGAESQCGWCKDKFGLSWQVIPQRLYDLLSDPDPERATAATQAMYGMRKIVIADLEKAVASV